jgi:hypothetical protein
LQPKSAACLLMLERHIDYKHDQISIEHITQYVKIELTAHSEAEGSSAATMPKAAIKARATGEKDFMVGN